MRALIGAKETNMVFENVNSKQLLNDIINTVIKAMREELDTIERLKDKNPNEQSGLSYISDDMTVHYTKAQGEINYAMSCLALHTNELKAAYKRLNELDKENK